jgi:integrase
MARNARLMLKEGKDPIDERRALVAQGKAAKEATVSFAHAAAAYHKHHSPKWKNPKDRAQWMTRMEKFAYPVLGAMPVSAIDRPSILRAFAPSWVEGSVHAASRCLANVGGVLEFATARGWRSGDNPARSDFSHDLPSPRTLSPLRPHSAMGYAEVPGFYASLGATVTERALAFTILTACRSNEVLGARWAEIDMDRALLTIPPERMKRGKEHVVPLSGPALAILRDLPREKSNPFVWIGQRPNTSLSRFAMIEYVGRRGVGVTVHGFRSSFRDWASEQTSFPPDLCETALAHQIGNAVERSYNRAQLIERRRALMAAWANHVTGVSHGQVIRLRA